MNSETTYNRYTLMEILRLREVHVKFRKINGDIRVMYCTLNPALLPDIAKKSVPDESTYINEEIVTAFDLEVQDWRSFRLDRIIQVI